jgi:HEPN domain-containing protein
MKLRILSYHELAEIDQLHSKANSILSQAGDLLRSYDCDLAVRRSQEAAELHTKTMFRFIGQEYPRSHDPEKTIYDVSALLQDYGVSREEVARAVLANATLGLWRLPSFYGDERLGVAKVFRDKEADVAVRYAGEVRAVCEKVRAELYRRAARARAEKSVKRFDRR